MDPTGLNYILLNRSYGAYGEGHNAVLVGNSNTGYYYFSKDNGSENTAQYFETLEDFYSSDIAKTYDRLYEIKTSEKADIKMITKGLEVYKRKYSLNEKYDEDGNIISQNCADLAAEIGREGDIVITQPKDSRFPIGEFTDPNEQFEKVLQDYADATFSGEGNFRKATIRSTNDENVWIKEEETNETE